MVILACVATLPLFGVAVYNAKVAERQELEHAYRETGVLARSLAALQANVLTETRRLLYGLAMGYQGRPEALFAKGCEATLSAGWRTRFRSTPT